MKVGRIAYWQYKLLKALGINPYSPRAQEALAGVGKHSRGSVPARNAKSRRKAANRQARTSRRRNRMVTNKRKNGRRKRGSR